VRHYLATVPRIARARLTASEIPRIEERVLGDAGIELPASVIKIEKNNTANRWRWYDAKSEGGTGGALDLQCGAWAGAQ
jgi:hypothetical protein